MEEKSSRPIQKQAWGLKMLKICMKKNGGESAFGKSHLYTAARCK